MVRHDMLLELEFAFLQHAQFGMKLFTNNRGRGVVLRI